MRKLRNIFFENSFYFFNITKLTIKNKIKRKINIYLAKKLSIKIITYFQEAKSLRLLLKNKNNLFRSRL